MPYGARMSIPDHMKVESPHQQRITLYAELCAGIKRYTVETGEPPSVYMLCQKHRDAVLHFLSHMTPDTISAVTIKYCLICKCKVTS